MKRLWLLTFLVTLSGCNGCATGKTRHATEAQLRQTIADTNARLTEVENQNQGLKDQVRRFATSWNNCRHGKGCQEVK